MYNRP
jgi:hypothetical protein